MTEELKALRESMSDSDKKLLDHFYADSKPVAPMPSGMDVPESSLGEELTEENCSSEVWEKLGGNNKVDEGNLPF